MTILYASLQGATLSTSLSAGGGTDDTMALNAALDSLQPGGGVLVVDGPALISSSLRLGSNVRLEFTPGGGLFLANGSNCPMIRNANWSKTTRTDHHIEITGGYLNGNGANQARQMADGTFTVGVAIFGAANVHLRGVHVYDAREWAIAFSNCDGFSAVGCRCECSPARRLETDGINIRGLCSNGRLADCQIRSGDDALALNSIDYGPGTVGPYIAGGDITNIVVRDIQFDDVWGGISLYSNAARVDRISVHHLVGRTQNFALRLNNGITGGNFGSVTFDGCDVVTFGAPLSGFDDLIQLGANAESIALSNIKVSSGIDQRRIVAVKYGTTIQLLTLNGFSHYDTLTSAVTSPRIHIAGTVERLSVSNYHWLRADVCPVAPSLIRVEQAARVSHLHLDSMTTNRVTALVVNIGTVLIQSGDAFPSGTASSLADGLISYWKLDEVSGIRADALGLNPLGEQAAIGSEPGKIGGAASLSAQAYFSAPDNPSLSVPAVTAFSLAGWFKMASAVPYMKAIAKSTSAGVVSQYEYAIDLDVTATHFRFIVGDGVSHYGIVTSGVTLAPGVWYFVAAVYDGTTLSLSVNGGTPDSLPYAYGTGEGSAALLFGAVQPGNPAGFWQGAMDEIGFWKRALSNVDITRLYNGGTGMTYPFAA